MLTLYITKRPKALRVHQKKVEKTTTKILKNKTTNKTKSIHTIHQMQFSNKKERILTGASDVSPSSE